jgi:hypothetical protein
MVKPGLTVSLTKGWPRVCVDLVKGFNRVHWRGFRGDDPGWSRFDQCSAGLARLIRLLVLMTLIKSWGVTDDFVFLFLPPCGSHLTPLATGSLESGLLASPLLGGPERHRPFTPTLHLHQRKSSRNLHLQYSAKSQSTPRCQSLITARSDHPPVLGRSGPQLIIYQIHCSWHFYKAFFDCIISHFD